ncbi:MAG TPA: cupredoxin domain-containing protein [Burkholderiales bacterium]|nr:cupredoxin domain-containing protein [Burkholderiales bacterium]
MRKLLFLCLLVPAMAIAQTPEFKLTIKDHKFSPAELKVPANKKVKLIVANEDPTPEEFESHALHREKVIPGGTQATIFIGPLRPGRYPFEGEFNSATAKGVVIAE